MLNHKNDSKSKLMNKIDLENISTIETEGDAAKTRIFDQLNQEYINYMLTKVQTLLYFSLISWFLLGMDTTGEIVHVASVDKEGINRDLPDDR